MRFSAEISPRCWLNSSRLEAAHKGRRWCGDLRVFHEFSLHCCAGPERVNQAVTLGDMAGNYKQTLTIQFALWLRSDLSAGCEWPSVLELGVELSRQKTLTGVGSLTRHFHYTVQFPHTSNYSVHIAPLSFTRITEPMPIALNTSNISNSKPFPFHLESSIDHTQLLLVWTWTRSRGMRCSRGSQAVSQSQHQHQNWNKLIRA